MVTRSKSALFLAGIVAGSVCLCYCFEWQWLKWLTAETLLHVANLCGLGARRIAWDVIEWQGTPIQFTTACTFVDVFFGAVPILWDKNSEVSRNLHRIAVAAVLLFILNIARLAFGFVLYTQGASWLVAHDVLGGFAYFAVWCSLTRQTEKRSLRHSRFLQEKSQRSYLRSAA